MTVNNEKTKKTPRIANRIILLLLAICFQSCGTISTWIHGPAYTHQTKNTLKQTIELVDSTGNKSIVLVPVVHEGSKEDYDKITYFIDGLKSNGYVTFYESVHIPDDLDSATIDLYYRKFRRILGSFSMMKPKKTARHNYWISQSESMLKEYMHLSTENDINADVSLVELVDHFERVYGDKILLTEYDMNCPLNDLTYKQKRMPNSFYATHSTIQDYRDEKLLEYVLNNNYNKIAVLYGNTHTCNLKYNLLNRGYRYKYQKK